MGPQYKRNPWQLACAPFYLVDIIARYRSPVYNFLPVPVPLMVDDHFGSYCFHHTGLPDLGHHLMRCTYPPVLSKIFNIGGNRNLDSFPRGWKLAIHRRLRTRGICVQFQ